MLRFVVLFCMLMWLVYGAAGQSVPGRSANVIFGDTVNVQGMLQNLGGSYVFADGSEVLISFTLSARYRPLESDVDRETFEMESGLLATPAIGKAP